MAVSAYKQATLSCEFNTQIQNKATIPAAAPGIFSFEVLYSPGGLGTEVESGAKPW